MGMINIPAAKKLVTGIILSPDRKYDDVLPYMEKSFGPVDEISPIKTFDPFSPFYKKEMGKDLKRFFITFQKPFDSGDLAGCKIQTNDMEMEFSDIPEDGQRKINIDPGYIGLANLIVASTKDASYRIYLRDGIYSQPMLKYVDRTFCPFEWTYPDYHNKEFISFFNSVRDKYKSALLT